MSNLFRIKMIFNLLMIILIIVIFFILPVYKIYKLTRSLSFGQIININNQTSFEEVITNLDEALQEFLKD